MHGQGAFSHSCMVEGLAKKWHGCALAVEELRGKEPMTEELHEGIDRGTQG